VDPGFSTTAKYLSYWLILTELPVRS